MLFFIAIATFIATLLGGLFALHFRDKLHLVTGFSAGAVIGVAFFDLLPESLELGDAFYDIQAVTLLVAIGFVAYLLLDRLIFLHAHAHEESGETHAHQKRGILGAASLSTHSFLDGVAIGLAFQVSTGVGLIVAAAVLAHDFSDGINTVSMILKNKGDRRFAFKWLLVDALAPVLGAASTLLYSVPEKGLGAILAVFTGFFLYIGASDLIPESQHAHPKFLTTVMTIAGMATLYVAISIAGM